MQVYLRCLDAGTGSLGPLKRGRPYLETGQVESLDMFGQGLGVQSTPGGEVGVAADASDHVVFALSVLHMEIITYLS